MLFFKNFPMIAGGYLSDTRGVSLEKMKIIIFPLWHLHQVLSTLLVCIYTKSLMERQQRHESWYLRISANISFSNLNIFWVHRFLFTNIFLLMFQMVFPICSPCVLYFSPSCFVTMFLIILLPQSCVL